MASVECDNHVQLQGSQHFDKYIKTISYIVNFSSIYPRKIIVVVKLLSIMSVIIIYLYVPVNEVNWKLPLIIHM